MKRVSSSQQGKPRGKHKSAKHRHQSSCQKAPVGRTRKTLRPRQPEIGKKNPQLAASYGVRYIDIAADADGQRIDNYLRKLLPALPKSRLYQMLRKGEVRLNKKRVKADARLAAGGSLRIPPVVLPERAAPFIPTPVLQCLVSSILYQDAHFMVINKPAGIAVHGGSKNQYGVIDVIQQVFPNEGWELCHRLDKDTSGCLVLANSRQALNTFQQQSRGTDIHKQYLALVKGRWQADELLIAKPIAKQFSTMGKSCAQFERIQPGGSTIATSIFTTREYYERSTLMQVVIKTGKTHQIRAHASQHGYPIAMDNKYGDFKWNRALEKLGLPRLFLHAHIIRFKAFGEVVHVSAELPDDLQRFIDQHD